MTTRAITIAREGDRWRAHTIDVDDAGDLDALADMIRDVGGEPAVAFVEEDDEYLAVVRLDEDDDPRVFLSDQRVVFTSPLAARLFADVLPSVAGSDLGARADGEGEGDGDGDGDEGALPHAVPAGDLDILADLGTDPEELIEVITERGALPSDAIAALAERAGCGDLLDEVGG